MLLLIVIALAIFVAVSVMQGPSSRLSGPRASIGSGYQPAPGPRGHIVFKACSAAATPNPPRLQLTLSGLRDAVTGLPLDPVRGLYRCGRCFVYYHIESFRLLREENQGGCVGCGGVSIVVVDVSTIPNAGSAAPKARNHQAGLTTLADYRSKVGQVVIFEGRCLQVLRSRRGLDYAAMFEPGTWSRGFKLVVFRSCMDRVGGPAFVQSLAGRRVRVRGLVVHDRSFGYEILVTDRSMILEVG